MARAADVLALAAAACWLAANGPARAQIEREDLPDQPPPSASPAAESSDETLARREAEAKLLYADGDLAGALRLHAELAATHPQAASRARLGLIAAWLAWQLEEPARALELLEAALFAFPKLEFAAENYSPPFVDAYRDALRVALHRRRVVASEAINRAVAELRAANLDSARALLEEALRLDPDDPDALYNLALVDLRAGRPVEALAGFDRVLALERGNPAGVTRQLKAQALNNAAVIYYSRGDFADAAAALEEAVRVEPDDGQAWFNLGLTREKLEQPDAAREALRRARQLAPRDVDVARAVAIGEMRSGNWVTAIGLLLEATRERPADPDLWLLLGRAQRGLGSDGRALESLGRALELDPEDRRAVGGTAALLLAELHYARREAAACEAVARRALALRPSDAGGWMFLGLARLEVLDAAAAVEALTRARELAPGRPDVLHNLGTAELAAGNLQAAREAFAGALAIDPDHPGTRAALAQLAASPAGGGAAARPELGAKLSAADYPELGLRGVRVDAVAPRSRAERAGLRVGDLVLTANGRAVSSPAELEVALRGRSAATTLVVLRSGQRLSLELAAS